MERAIRPSLEERSTKGLGRTYRVAFRAAPDRPYAADSTTGLIKRIGRLSVDLVKKEAALARMELRADLERELAAVKLVAVGAVFGLSAFHLSLVAVVFALAREMPGWAAALAVAGATLLVAGVLSAIGWSRRVRKPLQRTQQQLEEDVRWIRERFP